MEKQIKERPILFSGPMARALLAGTKTQTRRAIKSIDITDGLVPGTISYSYTRKGNSEYARNIEPDDLNSPIGILDLCPYGQPGHRLWVRETWGAQKQLNGLPPSALFTTGPTPIYYRADGKQPERLDTWRPSIHMPRAASRLLLEITAVRVERVQDISEADAHAEGVEFYANSNAGEDFPAREYNNYLDATSFEYFAADSFRTLWQSINGPESWAANPWVWVVEFKVIEPAPTPTIQGGGKSHE